MKNKLTDNKNERAPQAHSDRFDGNDLVERKEVLYKKRVYVVTSVLFQARGSRTSLLFKRHLFIRLELVDTH